MHSNHQVKSSGRCVSGVRAPLTLYNLVEHISSLVLVQQTLVTISEHHGTPYAAMVHTLYEHFQHKSLATINRTVRLHAYIK